MPSETSEENNGVVTAENIVEPDEEMRTIIDKAAKFVARIGGQFEQKVLEREKNNPKFSFLHEGDTHHPYYKNKIHEFKTEIEKEKEAKKTAEDRRRKLIEEDKLRAKEKKEQEAEERQSFFKKLLGEERSANGGESATSAAGGGGPLAPSRSQFILDPPFAISPFDLDLIKITAQYVSRNGPNFHMALLHKEARNPQYDFLKQNSSLNHFFNALVGAYTKCLIPDKQWLGNLSIKHEKNAPLATEKEKRKIKQQMLGNILQKVQWERMQEKKRKNAQELEAEDRKARANIDWHDFKVVETITFDDDEEEEEAPNDQPTPTPTATKQEDDNMDADMDMDMDMDDDESIEIRKDYVPVYKRNAGKELTQKCPICSQEIAVSQLQEHMRIELLDPRFASKREQLALNPGVDMAAHLSEIANKRSDIFEKGEEANNNKSSSSQDSKTIWDGHSASANATASAIAGKSIHEQIMAIHESKGTAGSEDTPAVGPVLPKSASSVDEKLKQTIQQNIQSIQQQHQQQQQQQQQYLNQMRPPFQQPPAPFGTAGAAGGNMFPNAMGMGYPQPAPFGVGNNAAAMGNNAHQRPTMEEPSSKRPKSVLDALINEAEFATQHPDPIVLVIQVPKQDRKDNWKLEGQSISITLPIKSSVSELKKEIKSQINMPANKQKLKVADLPFLKDNHSLAFYNLKSNVQVQLGVKERGRGKR